MADISYPTVLRAAIKSSKQVSRAAGFIESDPASGPSYTMTYTEDQPTFISFDLIFSNSEAMYFDAWVRQNKIFDQGLFFNFPINDMYGMTWQEVRFVSTGIPSSSEAGLVTSYSGCTIVIPDYQKPDPDFVFSLVESEITRDEISILDVTVNDTWPTI